MAKTTKVVTELTINKMTTSKYWEEKNAGRINPDELYLVVPDAEHVEMTWENIANKPELYTKAESDARYELKGEGGVTSVAWTDITDKPALYTKTESDERYQVKGNYLTSIPAEYLTETKGNSLYQPIGNYLTSIPSEYLTESDGVMYRSDFEQSLTKEGYCRLPNGLLMQWGEVLVGRNANTFEFPFPFENKALAFYCCCQHGHAERNWGGKLNEDGTFYIYCDQGGSMFTWFAIGV